MQYTKTDWKDHIVDGQGNIVQQGTPLSAGNLSKLERVAKDASVQLSSELAAQAAHSGVLDFEGINPFYTTNNSYRNGQIQVPHNAWFATKQNVVALTASKFLVNGIVLNLANTLNDILLSSPPTVGERDDFVFLEAWRDQMTQDWQTRLRSVSGVDFIEYSEGLARSTGYGWSDSALVYPKALPQGGNAAPVAFSTAATSAEKFRTSFQNPAATAAVATSIGFLNPDRGIYVAGDGTDISKGILRTYDGYVYAIPLFKVSRRNSGGYSVTNPNGARDYFSDSVIMSFTNGSNIATINVGQTLPDRVKVGDKVTVGALGGSPVITKINGRTAGATVEFSTNAGVSSGGSTAAITPASDRLDGLYPNIIDERDITDLRHKTYLFAPSYQQMLIDGLDQHLRGATQPERRKTMRKTYVGIRKTPLDANHVFYASFDGTTNAEIGGGLTLGTGTLKPGPTGGQYRFNNDSITPVALGGPLTANDGTIDFFIEKLGAATTREGVFELESANGHRALGIFVSSDESLQVNLYGSETADFGILTVNGKPFPLGLHHIRVTWKAGGTVNIYVDGKLSGTSNNYPGGMLVPSKVLLGNVRAASPGAALSGFRSTNKYSIGDVSVSNIDRGAAFATLPADFIAGYADITPAFNYQRRINSDVLTPQKSYAVAKVQSQTQERGVTVTKGAGVNTAAWEAGDKIKVRGLVGEIVGGVIDNDTALAKVAQTATNVTTFAVDDVSKLAVNDTITILGAEGGLIYGTRTITTVDPANKTITISSTVNVIAGQIIAETTASTSSPVVRSIIGGASTTVTGTWANLGTNEAEFTLGTLPGGLAAQEIIIEYSLNMPAGQGGLFQVYTSILGGEANGKKLVKGALAVTDDFIGKVSGSTTVNPNKAYSVTNGTTATPAAPGIEFSQADYDAIKSLDASLKTVTTSVNGQQAGVLISKDIIRIYEDKYGKIPGAYTVSEKVTWLKANLGKITGNVWAYGSGPVGNKVTLTGWQTSGSWFGSTDTHSLGAVTKLRFTLSSSPLQSYIDSNGFITFLVFADASNGVTASTVYVDQFNIEFEVNTKSGYDTLVPENPRRDDGLAGILYVRRQTREVESLFPGNDEDNGIIIIGDYLPSQELTGVSGTKDVLLSMQGFVTVAGTNKGYGDPNVYANAITRLLGPGDDLNYKVDPQSLVSTQLYDAGGNNGVLRYWYADIPNAGSGTANLYSDGIPTWAKAAEFLCGMTSIVELNGELLLKVQMRKRSQLSSIGLGGNTITLYFRIPGRPLIKL